MNWKQLVFLGALGCSLVLYGCGSEGAKENTSKEAPVETTARQEFPVTIENYNSQGNPVATTYNKPPQKIISLWQNSLETLLELGAANRIVAVSGIDDVRHLTPENQKIYPTLPLMTKYTLNQETAVTLHPDFILGWLFDFTGKANSIGTWDFWHDRHVPVYMTMMNNAEFLQKHVVEEELKYIEDVGKIVGNEPKAKEITNTIREQLQQYAAWANTERKPKVLIIGSLTKDLHVYTPRTLPGDIVTRLGGQVLGKEVESVGNAEIMSLETAVAENPDIIFIQSKPEIDQETLESVYQHPALQEVNAVKNKRVYPIPFYTIRCPAVRVRDAIDIVAKGLYPEHFTSKS